MTIDIPGWLAGSVPVGTEALPLLIIVIGVFMLRRRPQRPKQKTKKKSCV